MSQDFEARLRHALNEEADRVDPGVDDPVADVRRRARRQTRTQRAVVGLCVAALVVVAGAGLTPMLRDDMAVELDPVEQPPAEQALTNDCRNPADGYQIAYPEGWHANDGETVAPCRLFHPEEFDPAEGTEALRRAVSITVEDQPFATMRRSHVDRASYQEDLLVEDVMLNGRDAARVESVAGERTGSLPAGARHYTTLVDAGERTIVVDTTDQVRDIEYGDAKAVHERMVTTLRVDAGEGEPGDERDTGPRDEDGAEPDDGGESALAQECTNPQDGYTIGYPEGWHVDGVSHPCGWFHPVAFELPDAPQEITDKAVMVTVDPVPFDVASDPGDMSTAEVLLEEDLTVDGRSAVRYETVASGEAMFPEGTRQYTYVIDMGDEESMIVSTHDRVPDIGYEDTKAVMDRMVDSLRFDGPS